MTRMTEKTAPLSQQSFVALLRAREALYADIARLLKRHGLTEPQYNVLRIIRGAGPSGIPCREIGRRMITRVPDITRLLDRLETEGLVVRRRIVADRRVVLAALTAKGRVLLKQLDQPILRVHDHQFQGLTDQQLRTLTALLTRLAAALE